MSIQKPILYVVMPCYNEEDVLPETSRRMKQLLDGMISNGDISDGSRIMMIDDGSKDFTWGIIKDLHSRDKVFSGVKLAGNRGHQYALMAGLMTAREYCDISISIDADLQDDINVIKQMVDEYKKGVEVVYGVRSTRDTDTFFKKFTAQSYYKLLKKMGVNIVYDHADYRLLSRTALDALAGHKEVNLFLRGLVPVIGYPSSEVFYERSERFAGQSKYPIGKMLALAWQGITSFSTKPIRLITGTGTAFVLISALYLLIMLILGKMNYSSGILGSVWLLGGLIMASVGIVGEYVGKAYMETKQRPRYIIEAILND